MGTGNILEILHALSFNLFNAVWAANIVHIKQYSITKTVIPA
jgi:hypothetical protein